MPTWLAIVLFVVSVVVAVVTIAMPFLVWGTHTRVAQMETKLDLLASDLADLRVAVIYARMTTEVVEAVLQQVPLGDEVREAVEKIKTSRADFLAAQFS